MYLIIMPTKLIIKKKKKSYNYASVYIAMIGLMQGVHVGGYILKGHSKSTSSLSLYYVLT